MSSSHYFIGIKIPKGINEQVKAWVQKYKKELPFKQFVHEEDYHITLAFLGGTSDETLALLIKQLEENSKNVASFKLVTFETGVFGSESKPRVFWLGVHREENLFQLEQVVRTSCEESGKKLESRPYRPHITLAKRFNEGDKGIEERLIKNNDLQGLSWDVAEYQLIKINPSRTPKYEIIQNFSLNRGEEL
jgi:2'-5' RNA ligase